MELKFRSAGGVCLLMTVTLIFSGCMKDNVTRTYSIRTPIYQTLTKFRENIKSQPAEPVKTAGKISVMGKYIFLSEPDKGIHVIDNSNASSPKNISFINIPGNGDMAIKGNTLYADSYGDLVTFDISDPRLVKTKNFDANVFPDHSIYYSDPYIPGNPINPDSVNVVVGWTTHDTIIDINSGSYYSSYPLYASGCMNCMSIAAAMASPVKTIATNGSMARFSIINNSLYTVGYYRMTIFDISQAFEPAFAGTLDIGWQIETIYPFKDKLFVGSTSGMYMFDVQNSPDSPVLIGQFNHVSSCDPVITDGDYAYVTLHDGSVCQGFANELQIVDIKDMSNPVMLKSYQLTHPIGLSKDGDHLFICDGRDGLKVYNASDVNNLQLVKTLKDADVYDVVTDNGLAIVVASDGLYQYDYTDMTNVHLISKL